MDAQPPIPVNIPCKRYQVHLFVQVDHNLIIVPSAYKFVERAFRFPTKPFHDTLLVKFTETFQPCQFIADIIFDHAYRAFLTAAVLPNTVLLGRSER